MNSLEDSPTPKGVGFLVIRAKYLAIRSYPVPEGTGLRSEGSITIFMQKNTKLLTGCSSCAREFVQFLSSDCGACVLLAFRVKRRGWVIESMLPALR